MNITSSDFLHQSPLELSENEVQLWRAGLDTLRSEESRYREVLSAEEASRAERFRFDVDRFRYTASRALLRMILAGYLRTDPKEVTFSYSSKDKPLLSGAFSESDIHFNISHSGEVTLLAFARGLKVGVDVEFARRESDLEAIARRFFSAQEQQQLSALPTEERLDAFFRCWTRKEAYIKATGDGLSLPLHQFDVSIAAGSGDALIATRPDADEAGRWLLRDVPAGFGYAAALCVSGRNWRLKHWESDTASDGHS